MEAPLVDREVHDGLKTIRPDMHLRWDPQAVLIEAGAIDATGAIRQPKYEGRWEVWDVDPYGGEYKVMRVQTPMGTYRHPGDWLIAAIQRINPEHWGGDLEKMMEELVERPDELRELGTEKDTDDLFDAVGRWGQWLATPKSGPGLLHRGKSFLSA